MSEEESSAEARGEMEPKERAAIVLHESKLEKIFRGVCLNGAVLAVGLSLGLVGTALPDLQSRTNTGFDASTKVFVGRGMGFLVGSIASNYLLSLANQACWITSALVILTVTIATLPNCSSLALLMGTLFLQGAACGVVKAGCGFMCRHHFSRVDLAWGKILFVSFAVGAFIGPLLLLPFTGVAISGTPKIGSLHYNEDVPVPTTTFSTRLGPARNGLIAPNILARFHRKRRNLEEKATGFLPQNENITTVESVEMPAGFSADGSVGGSVAEATLAPNRITEESVVGEGDSLKQNDSVMEAGTMLGEERSDPISSLALLSPTLPALSQTVNTTTAAVVVNGSTSPLSHLSTIASTGVGSSTTKPIPKKPFAADGNKLSPEREIADSSKFRQQIRVNLKKDVPEEEEVKTTKTVPILETPSSSTTPNVANFSSAASINPDINITMLAAEETSTVQPIISLPVANVMPLASSPVLIQPALSLSRQSLVQSSTSTQSSVPHSTSSSTAALASYSTSASTQSPVPSSTSSSTQSPVPSSTSSSTQSPVPSSTSSSTQSPVPSSIRSSTQSSILPSTSSSTQSPILPSTSPSTPPSIPALQKSTHTPTSLSSKPTTGNATVSTATEKSSSVTPPNRDATENENPSEQRKRGNLWFSSCSYWLAALVVGIAATSFAFYWVLCPRVYQTGMSPGSDDLQAMEPPKVASSCRFLAFLVVMMFHLLYSGLEVTFSVFVTSYAVFRLGWSGSLGVLLGVTYWGLFVTCRIVTFVLFRYVRQSLLMFGGLLLCIVATGGTFISLQHELCESDALVWVTIGALGFGMAAILPGGVAEIEKVFPHHAELFQVLGSSVGEMVLPPVFGIVMTIEDSVWLAYIVLAAFVLCTVVTIAIRFLVIRASEGRMPRNARSMPSLENDDLEDVLTNTNDETELLAKSSHSQTGSPLNGSGNGTQAVTQMAIQSLMKNISNTKKD